MRMPFLETLHIDGNLIINIQDLRKAPWKSLKDINISNITINLGYNRIQDGSNVAGKLPFDCPSLFSIENYEISHHQFYNIFFLIKLQDLMKVTLRCRTRMYKKKIKTAFEKRFKKIEVNI